MKWMKKADDCFKINGLPGIKYRNSRDGWVIVKNSFYCTIYCAHMLLIHISRYSIITYHALLYCTPFCPLEAQDSLPFSYKALSK